MNCELNLVPLSCDRQGVGFTSHPLSEDSNRLRLMKGHAKHFPVLEGQQYFYIKIRGCKGCCETAKVIGIEEDTFILDRTTSGLFMGRHSCSSGYSQFYWYQRVISVEV